MATTKKAAAKAKAAKAKAVAAAKKRKTTTTPKKATVKTPVDIRTAAEQQADATADAIAATQRVAASGSPMHAPGALAGRKVEKAKDVTDEIVKAIRAKPVGLWTNDEFQAIADQLEAIHGPAKYEVKPTAPPEATPPFVPGAVVEPAK